MCLYNLIFHATTFIITVSVFLVSVNCDVQPTPSYPVIINTTSGIIEGAITTYSCVLGYVLSSGGEQICINSSWIGQEPECSGIHTQ